MPRGVVNAHPKVINCASCGRLFQSLWGNHFCPECQAMFVIKEEEVIEYVVKHRNSTIAEVAEKCEVSISFIRKMIERGRFVAREADMLYPCHACGAQISAGNYCPQCLARIKQQLNETKERILENMKKEGKLKVETLKSERKRKAVRKSKTHTDSVLENLAGKTRGMLSFNFLKDN